MKYVATFIQADAEAVSGAALVGWRHHINTWVSASALPQHVPFHDWEAAGSPPASPSHAMGSASRPPQPSPPTPHQWGHPSPLTGRQKAEVEIHREGILGTAVLQTRGRVRDGKLQLCAGIATGATAQGQGPVPRRGVRAHQHITHISSHLQPQTPPGSQFLMLLGMMESLLELKSTHRAITEMGPANPTSWRRPGLGQSKHV